MHGYVVSMCRVQVLTPVLPFVGHFDPLLIDHHRRQFVDTCTPLLPSHHLRFHACLSFLLLLSLETLFFDFGVSGVGAKIRGQNNETQEM